MIGRIAKVRKRDGRLVDFDEAKIADAIHKAGCAVGSEDRFMAEELAGVVTLFLEKRYAGAVPGIEEIQDMVEKVLIETGHARMAKAYILYRERRARAREQVTVAGEPGTGPRVGSPAHASVSSWSKGRIADALVREADLDERVAVDVAARVEAKVFESGIRHITTNSIRSLVEAELLLLGYGDRVGRQALVGLPRYDVDRLLRTGKGTRWRPAGPRDLKTALADAVLAQYALMEVYSSEVVEAHLDARLHITDVGSPFEWVAAAVALPEAGDADEWVEAAALLAGRLGGMVTREVTLTGLPAEGAAASAPGGALGTARRLLGHSALRTLDRRGGRFRLALSLPVLPDPDGLVEALVREHWARFRDGPVESLPSLVAQVSADRVPEEAARRPLLPALAAAAETGRLQIVFDRADPAPVVTPWYRLPAAELVHGHAVPVGGAVSVNVGRLAGGKSEAELLEALDEAIVLAAKALRQKRNFLASLQVDPGTPLYRVAGGARPLVAGGQGLDLVHLVGLRAAAARLERKGAAAARLAGRLRSYAAVRLAEEGRRIRLQIAAAPDRDGEAAARFAAKDPRSYLDREPFALPAGAALDQVEALYDAVGETLLLRFPRERAPAPEALYDALCLLAGDSRIRSIRLLPWPDRSVRAASADVRE